MTRTRHATLLAIALLAMTAGAQRGDADQTPRIVYPPALAGTWTAPGFDKIEILDQKGTFTRAGEPQVTVTFSVAHDNGQIVGLWRRASRSGALSAVMAEDRRSLRISFADLDRPRQLRTFTWRRTGDPPERPRLVLITDPDALKATLMGAVHVVGFDDIDTSKTMPVPFAADHYAKSHGLVIEGTGGQFVDRAFGYPTQFVAHSKPNMYAPGPVTGTDPQRPRGGCRSTVRFTVRGRPAAVAGFGAWFHDVDNYHLASSMIVAFDRAGRWLGTVRGMKTPDGGKCFRGLVAVSEHGAPLPLVASLRLHNGDGWAGTADGEGVSMDDFTFGIPVALPRKAPNPRDEPTKKR